MVSPNVVENEGSIDQVASPSCAKFPKVENNTLESLRDSLREEIPSEIKNLLAECQSKLLKLRKPDTRECINEEEERSFDSEIVSVYTPTKIFMTNSTPNNHPNRSRNSISKLRTPFRTSTFLQNI